MPSLGLVILVILVILVSHIAGASAWKRVVRSTWSSAWAHHSAPQVLLRPLIMPLLAKLWLRVFKEYPGRIASKLRPKNDT